MPTVTDCCDPARTSRSRFPWALPVSASLGLAALGILDGIWGIVTGGPTTGAGLLRYFVCALALLLVTGFILGWLEGLLIWGLRRLARSLAPAWQGRLDIAAIAALPVVVLGGLGWAVLHGRWPHLGGVTAALAVAGLAVVLALCVGAVWLGLRALPWLVDHPRRRASWVAVGWVVLTVTAVVLDRRLLVGLYDELHVAFALGAFWGAQLTVLSLLMVVRSTEHGPSGWTAPTHWRPIPWVVTAALALGLWVKPPLPEVYAQALSGSVIQAKVLRLARAVLDFDRDGHSALLGGGDCDDGRAAVNPSAVELPENGVDDDCVGGDLTLEMLGPRVALSAHPVTSPVPEGLNILLLTIDGVRWDHLGIYGYYRNTSPAIDRLAREAMVFERAYAPSNSTAASFPSLLTGRHPSSSPWSFDSPLQVAEGWPYLQDEDNVTLPEYLAGAGYTTLAVARGAVVFRLGLRQGFERISASFDEPDVAVREALDWVADRRFFFWVHYDYPHHPYEPNELVEFGTAEIDRYDGEISRADAEVTKVLELLRERGLIDRTIIVVTADHGEEFGDHGGRFHATTLHEEQIHVPLLLRIPSVAPARILRPVGLVDVVPTLLECAGVAIPPQLDGLSLLHSYPTDVTTAYSELYDGQLRQRAIVLGRWKLINDVETNQRQLYDLSRDPEERRNLTVAHPAIAAQLMERLSRVAHRRTLVMLALAGRGEPGSVVQLARSLAHLTHPDLVRHAATLIADSGVDAAVPPLVATATTKRARPDVRRAALQALAGLGGAEARGAVEELAAGEGSIPATARRLLDRWPP